MLSRPILASGRLPVPPKMACFGTNDSTNGIKSHNLVTLLPIRVRLTGGGEGIAADDWNGEAVCQACLGVRVRRPPVLDGVREAGAALRFDALSQSNCSYTVWECF